MAREDVDIRARHRFIEALAGGMAPGQAAKDAGYSRMHGWRLRQDPAFLAAVERRRLELAGVLPTPAGSIVSRAAPRPGQAVGSRADAKLAKDTLKEIAQDPEAPAVARVAASKALIELARKPIVKPSPLPEAPSAPVIQMLPVVDDGKEAEAWLKSQV